MFNRRTLLGLITATALIGTTSITMAADKPYIAIICKGFQAEFWQAVKAGAEQAGKDLNVDVNFEGPDGEGAVDHQLDMLSAELAKHPAAIGIAAIDSQAAVPVLQKFADAKIPIIAFDSGVDSDLPLTTASTDNLASAALAADKLAAAINNEGNVGVVSFDQTSQTGIQRRDGFLNEIKAKFPKINIVDVEYFGTDPSAAADTTKAMLLGHPDLKAIFATNEPAAIGAGIAKKEAKSNIVVVGYDSGAPQIADIKDGTLLGSITQNPVGIGYQVVKAAVDAIAGKTLPKHIDTGFFWYDNTNLTDPKIAADLYQ
jgi:ribose transport system substrate-binding protein